MKKIYKRFPIKEWQNYCEECCMFCDLIENCNEGCIIEEITCNQCLYNRED